ncbi:hypothetical protein Agub_g6438 [Astrephomene gubernaculifera]|uniref:Mediator of RNA polymerase II transcription subunit 30 n=1 Tax=Astrephomene gubernaculifera TaxID=47775 RepID=A0AAD3HLT6_9CHLO|nr:hypothetical protein Agub_g6438 [Astrephomene gubernaculifera]
MAQSLNPSALCGDLHALAALGIDQLHNVIEIVRQLFGQIGYGDADDTMQRQAALQHQYLAAVGALRRTLEQCIVLSSQLHSGDCGADAVKEEPVATADDMATRLTQLQAELSGKNEVVKQLIDQLRQMLESISMWESHKHMLERYKLAEGH